MTPTPEQIQQALANHKQPQSHSAWPCAGCAYSMWDRQKNALITVRALIIINGIVLMESIRKTSRKRYAEIEEKRGKGQFIGIRKKVFLSEAWSRTSSSGIRLIMDLTAQYNGDNNGDLCAAWSIMRGRGWNSNATLIKARHELEERRWVIVTRKGTQAGNGKGIPTLYALTFWGIDECNQKLDPGIIPSNKPRDSWKIGNAPPDIVEEQRKERQRKINSSSSKTGLGKHVFDSKTGLGNRAFGPKTDAKNDRI